MPTIDPRVDAYIEEAAEFAQPILKKIRRAFHVGCPQVVETIKWKAPHFDHDGLLGGMSAFKAHVTFGFMRGRELDDPAGLFEGVGDTEMCAAKITTPSELPTQKVLADYVRRAAKYHATTPKPKRASRPKRPVPKPPAELTAALNTNKPARTFFDSLAPGQKREYIEWLAEGKRRNWKYENC